MLIDMLKITTNIIEIRVVLSMVNCLIFVPRLLLECLLMPMSLNICIIRIRYKWRVRWTLHFTSILFNVLLLVHLFTIFLLITSMSFSSRGVSVTPSFFCIIPLICLAWNIGLSTAILITCILVTDYFWFNLAWYCCGMNIFPLWVNPSKCFHACLLGRWFFLLYNFMSFICDIPRSPTFDSFYWFVSIIWKFIKL